MEIFNIQPIQNMKLPLPLFTLLCLLLLTACSKQETTFTTDAFELRIDESGNVTSFIDKRNSTNYIENTQKSPLLAIRINNEYQNPTSATWNPDTEILSLNYPVGNTQASIKILNHSKYLVMELTDIQSDKEVELVVWGPYPTTISKTIGECVGVVRDDAYAIGIQALNPKTIGGYPTTEDDVDPSFDIFATNSLVDVADSLKILYRGQTARHTDYGSVLQAYSRNRDKDRIIPMWGHEHYVAPAYNDGGVIGSKLALFGCPEDQTLDYIEEIELNEGLPHPELNGVWMKRAPEAAQAYIIYPFNEKNIEEAIAFTKKTGLKYLYHAGPFETWGKFKLNPSEFPSGMDGLKNCVDIANKSGIKLGIHTLSNFITTNDTYVTPVPDKRLAKVGSSVLVSDIDDRQTEIEIKDPKFFNQMQNNSLHGVMVGEELIRYERVNDSAPWKLINCQRGAWGTQSSSHSKNDEISKLMDHGYKVFLTDIDLTKEVARNIADIFNQTGIEQISFDGLEGAWSTGLGQYGLSLMIQEWYEHLKPEHRNNINDASMTTHYNWHTFTRMNWGEPWYAGFRESQMNYRLMNQDFYRRNLIPCMLGWFKFDANTSIEDIEWLLARSAAFDAGYTLVTNKANVEQNGLSEEIIRAIREWENARLSGAFPKELKLEMERVANEYTLTQTGDETWNLYPYHVQRFKHENIVRQPGEPVVSKWTFNNKYERQPIQFILKATDRISSITLEIANYSTISIPGSLEKGEYLKYTGNDKIGIYDKNWNLKRNIPVENQSMMVPENDSQIIFSCKYANVGGEQEYVSGEFKTMGKEMSLKSTRKVNK